MKKIYPLIIEVLLLLLTLITISIMLAVGEIEIIGLLITIIILYLANILIATYIFIKERNLETKISWIIFIIFIPIIGHATFIFLGINNKNSISKIQYEKEFNEFLNNEINICENNYLDNFQRKLSFLTKRKWKQSYFEIENHSFDSYQKLFDDIQNAKQYVHIEMYIIKPSEIYSQFKSLLLQKVQEGVEIRMIIDDFGKWLSSDNEILELKEKGIKINVFNKITFPFINIKQSFRLHRKMIIIDGIIVHTGGLNISDEYYSFDKKYGYWIDVNARVTGEICNDFSQLFLYDWFKVENEKLSPLIYIKKQENLNCKSNSLFLEEGPEIKEYILEQSLINCLIFSNKKIRIATPYFIPSKKILEQFKFSLLEGVEIEIFIPGLADKKYILEATHLYLRELILAGAKVYEVNSMFLHSKIATFDNKYGYLGTINWDMRSLFSNYESLNFLSGEVVVDIDSLLDNYKKYSTLINSCLKKKKSPISYFKLFFIKIFSPLM